MSSSNHYQPIVPLLRNLRVPRQPHRHFTVVSAMTVLTGRIITFRSTSASPEQRGNSTYQATGREPVVAVLGDVALRS